MNHVWLKQNNEATHVIVVFGGWAVGSDVFSSLAGASDVLFISDYRDLNDNLPDLSAYSKRTLIAWSFGIASYCHWQENRADIFDRKIAINGTMTPVDRERGIPLLAMQKTIDTLSQNSFQVFLRRAHNAKVPEQRIDVGARKAELIAILERGDAPLQLWDRIWLSRKDRIFPLANMERAWEPQSDMIKTIDAAHVPFSFWQSWNEVCDE
ncbi:MAG: pimeloyl-ACP methyl esterase BioG family protein [Hyphomicrobiales bacterium]